MIFARGNRTMVGHTHETCGTCNYPCATVTSYSHVAATCRTRPPSYLISSSNMERIFAFISINICIYIDIYRSIYTKTTFHLRLKHTVSNVVDLAQPQAADCATLQINAPLFHWIRRRFITAGVLAPGSGSSSRSPEWLQDQTIYLGLAQSGKCLQGRR